MGDLKSPSPVSWQLERSPLPAQEKRWPAFADHPSWVFGEIFLSVAVVLAGFDGGGFLGGHGAVVVGIEAFEQVVELLADL